MTTLESQPLGMIDRLKAAGSVLANGKLPNKLDVEPEKSRGALVKELNKWVIDEREFWQPVFKRIREEQTFACGKQWSDGSMDKYIGDIVQQLINRVVAALYAKNPTPDAKREEKLLYEVWDGSPESFAGAQAILEQSAQIQGMADQHTAQTGIPVEPPPQFLAAQAIVDDHNRGQAEKALLDKIAKTAKLLIEKRWAHHKPNFTVLMKQNVTTAVVSRVGFLQVMYRRDMEPSPIDDATTDTPDKLAQLEQLKRELESPDFDPDGPIPEELRLMMQELAREKPPVESDGKITYEGTTYQLVAPTSVIIDRNCTCLWEFMGARRIAREQLLDIEAAEKRFKCSLRDCGAIMYTDDGEKQGNHTKTQPQADRDNVKLKVCIWHVYDKDDQLCYVICDGVKNFLEEPYCPTPELERFFNIVPLTLNCQVVERNDPENDTTIYPRSHVRLQMPMQVDINTAGEGLREHRVANRPWWAFDKSKLTDDDLRKMSRPRNAHDAIGFSGMSPDGDIKKALMPGPNQPIDPMMYDPQPSLQAALLATGLQAADLGTQGKDEKATGQAIAQGERISADQSNIHGVDFALSVIAQATFEMEIQETGEQTVKQLCGRGAIWPTLSKADIRGELYVEVEAGSSGRPNQALEIQNFEKLVPLLMPLIQNNPAAILKVTKEGLRRLNDKWDVNEIVEAPQPLGQPQGQMPAAQGQPSQPGAPLPPGQPSATVKQPGLQQPATHTGSALA